MEKNTIFGFSLVLITLSFFTDSFAENSLPVCESKSFTGKYQCTSFLGEHWNRENAIEACESGTVNQGNAGSLHQNRCDPVTIKGMCLVQANKANAYGQCNEIDGPLRCWFRGGKWITDQSRIQKHCFPKAPADKPIVNMSKSLEEILEYGEIFGACDRYFADTENASRREMLLCGKWMYFYEHFNFFGAPTALFTFMQENLPETVGAGWEKLGMFKNPYDARGLPVGLADAPNFPESDVPTVNWTCASCHFGKTPDGRFVVGQSNNQYEYGKQLLFVTLFPLFATGFEDPKKHAPEAMAAIQPLLDEWKSKPNLIALILTLLTLRELPQQTPMDLHQEKSFASWKAGVQDPVMFPNLSNDKVHTPLKILSAYGIPTPKEFLEHGKDPQSNIRIGWAGGMDNLYRFGRTFVSLGTDDPHNWTDERLKPLVEYLYSLKPPKNSQQLDEQLVTTGRELFETKQCAQCHDGPRHMGMGVFDFDEIGTDAALKWYFDAEQDYGLPDPNINPDEPITLTHAVKAPKLAGLWTQNKFLHNGSVDSLANLFCLDRARPTILEEPFSDKGHMQTCDNLTRSEKLALMEYLNSL